MQAMVLGAKRLRAGPRVPVGEWPGMRAGRPAGLDFAGDWIYIQARRGEF